MLSFTDYTLLGGLLYYAGDSDDASLNPALNAAMLLSRFSAAGLASSTEKQNAYADFAQGQLDYALGNNPMTGEFRLPEGIPESS